jgi:hypothetical protein
MMGEHWFWLLLLAACIVWYSTITVYVAIKGGFDIAHMLGRLADQAEQSQERTEP